MLLHRLLEDSARRTPEATAVIEPKRAITYGELNWLANAVGNRLVRDGVRRGDRVVIALENSIELVAAYFGALKAGAAAVPLPAGPRSDRLARAVQDCTPSACIVDGATASEPSARVALAGIQARYLARAHDESKTPEGWGASFERVLAEDDGTPTGVRCIDLDLAAIIYTSGSTGEPRGVMLTHRNIVANTRSIVSYLRLTSNDRVMCVLPFYYVYGLSLLHTHIAVGGSIVIDNRFAFPNVVLKSMQEHQVTGFAGVPSTFALLLNRSNLGEIDLPHLRYVTQAGGGMSVAQIQKWLARGPQVPFYVMYGATEASARLTYLDPADLPRKLGSIGRPIPNVEIVVVKDDGQPAAPGEVGELVARGSNISSGYWNDPAQTAEKFTALGYRTGDLGYADEEGYLFLVGRRHDMIKVGAHRVGAKEIEDTLYEYPPVHEAAVVAVPDDLLGEVPVAFVVLTRDVPDASATLLQFCASRLPSYKIPARLHITHELPKIPGIGKIDKAALRALATAVSLFTARS